MLRPYVVQTEYQGEQEFNDSIRDTDSVIDRFNDELLGENSNPNIRRQSGSESR
jgi:hypothetical protein